MHRCCAIRDSSHRFLTIKNVRLSHYLDLWKSAMCSTTSNKTHHHQITAKDVRQRILLQKPLEKNQRTCRNNVNIIARSYLFLSSHVSHISPCPNSFSLAQQSRFIHLPIPFKRNQDFSALDKIPEGYECIYTTALNIYTAYFYPFIVFGTLAGLIPFVIETFHGGLFLSQQPNENIATFDNNLQILATIPFVLGVAYVAKYFADSCPLRIYVNEDDQFIAVFATLLPWRTSKSLWNACDIQNLFPIDDERPTMWNMLRGSHIVGKKRLIILPYAFKHPHYYNVLLGNTLEHMNKKQDKFVK